MARPSGSWSVRMRIGGVVAVGGDLEEDGQSGLWVVKKGRVDGGSVLAAYVCATVGLILWGKGECGK